MAQRLNRGQLDAVGALLAQRRAELKHAIDTHLAENAATRYGDLLGQVGDLEDHALAELLVDDNLAEIQREIAALRDTQAAEGRLATGTLGICVDCGEAIAFDRLQARPTAACCIACQQARERGRAPVGHTTL